MFYGGRGIVVKLDRERYLLLHDFLGKRYLFKRRINER